MNNLLTTILTSSIVATSTSALISYYTQKKLKGYEVRAAFIKENYDKLKSIVVKLSENSNFTIIEDGEVSAKAVFSASADMFTLASELFQQNKELFTEEDIKDLNSKWKSREEAYIKITCNVIKGDTQKSAENIRKLTLLSHEFFDTFKKITNRRLNDVKKKLEKI